MPAHPVQLIRHPAYPSDAVSAISFAMARRDNGAVLRYEVRGNIDQIKRSKASGGVRRDGLWQTTCFEVFLQIPGAASYAELNFAANGDWAAYGFSGYRADMAAITYAPPVIQTEIDGDRLRVEVGLKALPVNPGAGGLRLGPAVIIETLAGTKSYWALHHPPEQPDFHQIQNFQIELD
jgi:hypothetical protein